MRTLLARLVLLVAVLLMPIGMAPATASAVPHGAAATMPMQHCPDQAPGKHGKTGFVECTMACAGALPAADTPQDAPVTIVRAPEMPVTAGRLNSLHPDTATPPPKRS